MGMKSHPELYESSLELEDLVKEYTSNNDYELLEKALLDLVYTYGWLNFYEEDEYLENLIDTHLRLASLYSEYSKDIDAYNAYMNALEAYDDLIEIDKKYEEIFNKDIMEIKDIYAKIKELVSKLGINDNVVGEYPRLKKYLD